MAGIEGRLGSLTLGSDYTPLYYVGLMSDAFRYGLWENAQALLASAGGSERFARVSNGVFYQSPVWQGLRLRAVYSFGSESAGGTGNLPRNANALELARTSRSVQSMLATCSDCSFQDSQTTIDVLWSALSGAIQAQMAHAPPTTPEALAAMEHHLRALASGYLLTVSAPPISVPPRSVRGIAGIK